MTIKAELVRGLTADALTHAQALNEASSATAEKLVGPIRGTLRSARSGLARADAGTPTSKADMNAANLALRDLAGQFTVHLKTLEDSVATSTAHLPWPLRAAAQLFRANGMLERWEALNAGKQAALGLRQDLRFLQTL
ncbi:MAG: hypothetical protein AAFQ82_01985 [Myxococcota bacterium]